MSEISWSEQNEKNKRERNFRLINCEYFLSNEEFFLGLFKERGEEVSGWEMTRKDNAINRLGQKKAELKILSLQKIPFPDLSHHKKKKKEKFSLKARYETQEWRRNC